MILIALGANLPSSAGPPEATLRAALDALRARGIGIAVVSRFYRTSAWPDRRDPDFVNAVARLDTELAPAELLAILHDVEMSFGRKRSAKNAPRTLDLDLLDYDGLVCEASPSLPHPRLDERAFVLVPLRDVAPGWRHPVSGRSVDELIAALGPAAGEPVPIT
jgi:2-amino-4-hydroxy-6-hydroxymethyldihydropteridine diphosphokinase